MCLYIEHLLVYLKTNGTNKPCHLQCVKTRELLDI
jgi:hypothetical protein